MADGNQPAPTTQPKPADVARVGSPGTANDSVTISRLPASKPKKAEEKPAEIKDSFREIIETIVFVVVLVFMLKTFLAEAFVIPTGSMATTLYGYHRDIVCKQCGKDYAVDAAAEAEGKIERRPRNGNFPPLTAECPNCQFPNPLP